MPRCNAPGLPDVTTKITSKKDDSGQFAPVLYITWSQLPDGKTYMITHSYAQDYKLFKNNQIISCKLPIASSSNRTCTDGQHNYLFKAFFLLNNFPQGRYSLSKGLNCLWLKCRQITAFVFVTFSLTNYRLQQTQDWAG